ncbi:MAG: hypothetical protein IJO81_05820 [Clostridia bacterium]|nr:hypothetical protein [Clostridia bacterium]
MYKTELHCHSSEVSGCSSVDVHGVVEKYIRHGYTTVVLTNHICGEDDFENYTRRVNKLFYTCDKAREAAGDKLCVLDGAEFRLKDDNDYLLIGVTKEFLLSERNFHEFEPYELKEKANAHGILVIEAHPLRYGQRLCHPDWVDGYEVHNGHPEQRSHNDAMELLADELRREGKILTSGTDHHDGHHMPNSGIATDEPITTLDGLVDVLKNGRYSLIKKGEIVKK